MPTKAALHDFLVISKGQWDKGLDPSTIQAAIDGFYDWYEQLIEEGKIKPGQRLATEGRLISKDGVIDGPFAESKEIIGGFWIIVARNLDEATELAAGNPCIACGLTFEVRPIELKRASAYQPANETPK